MHHVHRVNDNLMDRIKCLAAEAPENAPEINRDGEKSRQNSSLSLPGGSKIKFQLNNKCVTDTCVHRQHVYYSESMKSWFFVSSPQSLYAQYLQHNDRVICGP